jgi:NAD(P)-dependent dehydrogenase (short-subunit alcohol dehydrogenase family)
VARVIAFLLSDAADHVSGTEMRVDAATSLVVG